MTVTSAMAGLPTDTRSIGLCTRISTDLPTVTCRSGPLRVLSAGAATAGWAFVLGAGAGACAKASGAAASRISRGTVRMAIFLFLVVNVGFVSAPDHLDGGRFIRADRGGAAR